MARPSSAEPLHGVDANAKLVATMGKRPEEEDAAIAQEWSPRGGRKLNNAQGPPRACAIERQDQRECGVDSGWESSSLPSSPEAPWSCSLLPLCQQQRNRARPLEVRGRRRGNRNSFSNSPGGERRARDPWKPIHDSSGHNVPLPSTPNLLARGQSGRHDDVQNYGIATAAPFDDDIFSNSSNGQGDDSDELRVGFSADFNALGQGFSPAPPSEPRQFRGSASPGNLGGNFAMLGSPYRTYRAKHARLLRARSSERAEAEKRPAALEHRVGGGASRSRSADSGVRSERRWRGTSGMTSPLLHREGFGLLQSKTTGKVSRVHAHPHKYCELTHLGSKPLN